MTLFLPGAEGEGGTTGVPLSLESLCSQFIKVLGTQSCPSRSLVLTEPKPALETQLCCLWASRVIGLGARSGVGPDPSAIPKITSVLDGIWTVCALLQDLLIMTSEACSGPTGSPVEGQLTAASACRVDTHESAGQYLCTFLSEPTGRSASVNVKGE